MIDGVKGLVDIKENDKETSVMATSMVTKKEQKKDLEVGGALRKEATLFQRKGDGGAGSIRVDGGCYGISGEKGTNLEVNHTKEETKGGRKKGDGPVGGRVRTAGRFLNKKVNEALAKGWRKAVTEVVSEELSKARGNGRAAVFEKEGGEVVRPRCTITKITKGPVNLVRGHNGVRRVVRGRSRRYDGISYRRVGEEGRVEVNGNLRVQMGVGGRRKAGTAMEAKEEPEDGDLALGNALEEVGIGGSFRPAFGMTVRTSSVKDVSTEKVDVRSTTTNSSVEAAA